LADGMTGATLWTKHFDRDQRDILETQAELAQAVTSALRVRLIGADTAGLTLGGTINPQALDAYLRAVAAARDEKSEADFDKEIAWFDEAVALDPGFATAQARRAIQLWSNAARTSSNDRAYVNGLKNAALVSAQNAVALAPDLAVAHLAMGFALGAVRPDFAKQEAEFTRARELEPGSAEVAREYSRFESFAGHSDRAVSAAEQAVALDALTARSYVRLAWALYWAHRPDDALEALHHASEIAQVSDPTNAYLKGMVFFMRGDKESARAACQGDRDWPEYLCLAIVYHAMGKLKEAMAEVAKLDALGAESGPFAYAEIYAQWGRFDDALTWLEKAYNLPDQGIIQIEGEPSLDPIRHMPRFKEIERRLDVPPK
jgi:serine/threonine-protein kinase